MDQLVNTPFNNLEIPSEAKVQVFDKTIMLTKFNWDFSECENFQLKVNELVRANKDYKFYIFTNHPHVFTLGRGNERGQSDLIDFDPALANQLKFSVHKIHRGGGITFHYPGQWIFYPICAINNSYTLDDHMCWILKTTKNALVEFYKLDNLITAKKLMGIWREKKKLASIGVGLKKFTSLHGLALNLVHDDLMYSELKKTNPCGLNPAIYHSVDQFTQMDVDIQKFNDFYINTIT